jgi:hypothetical protein
VITVDNIADAIFRTEGGTKTRHPYGILRKFQETTPRQACLNTVKHAMKDYHYDHCDRAFIYFLADRYCPTKSDAVGNVRWKANMVAILRIKE